MKGERERLEKHQRSIRKVENKEIVKQQEKMSISDTVNIVNSSISWPISISTRTGLRFN